MLCVGCRDHGRRCDDLLTQHIARIRRPRSGVKRWLKGEEREMTEIPLTGFVPATGMPTDATAFTPAMLNEMIAPWHPDIRIARIRILENKAYGDGMVSTAARAVLDVDYAEGDRKSTHLNSSH